MKNYFRKIIIFGIAFFLSILLVGCDYFSFTTTAATTTSSVTTTTSSLTTTTSTTSSSSDTTATSGSTTYVGLEVVNIAQTEYNIGTSFDYSSIVVMLDKSDGSKIPLGSSIYSMSGFDSSTPGVITITISYSIYQTSFDITILESTTNLDITMAYYASAQDLTGQQLMDILHTIINTGYTGHDYYFASTALSTTDKDPANASNVILVYTGYSVSGTWDSGATWNKEHVWPQSLLGETAGSSINMASDLHNLKPANPSMNSSRSNKYYDILTTTNTFEPRDEVKGDIARILFYMATMYTILELVDQYPNVHQMALLSVLLEWNALDPVDDFERNRNEVIYGYQNNRNPYIDYPELVDLVWDNLPTA
jgi:endonuclease I